MNHRQRIAFMAQAYMLAGLSYAPDRKVGAYILQELDDGTQQLVSCGYNGTAPGESNETVDENGQTLATTIHGERNAIYKAAKSTISCEGSTLFVTLTPCPECVEWIKGVGVKKVVYCEPSLKYYSHDVNPISSLHKSGIEVIQVDIRDVLNFIRDRVNFVEHAYFNTEVTTAVGTVHGQLLSAEEIPSASGRRYLLNFEKWLSEPPTTVFTTHINGIPVKSLVYHGENEYEVAFDEDCIFEVEQLTGRRIYEGNSGV